MPKSIPPRSEPFPFSLVLVDFEATAQPGLPWITLDFRLAASRIRSDPVGSTWIRCDWVESSLIYDCLNLASGTKPGPARTPWIWNAEFIPQKRPPRQKSKIRPATFQTFPFSVALMDFEATPQLGLPWITLDFRLAASRIRSDPVGSGAIESDWGATAGLSAWPIARLGLEPTVPDCCRIPESD